MQRKDYTTTFHDQMIKYKKNVWCVLTERTTKAELYRSEKPRPAARTTEPARSWIRQLRTVDFLIGRMISL